MDEVEASSRSSRLKLRRRLRQCDSELLQLRSDYDAEVQTCAELREQLEERDTEINEALFPLQDELAELQASLEAVQAEECHTMMRVEDQFGIGNRLLAAKDKEIQFLEKRLHLLTQSYTQILGDDQDVEDTAAEEALRATDVEVSELQASVQLREKQIAGLSVDLKNILDYMIRVNIDAAGAGDDLSVEDFLPSEVQSHLNLGEYGKSHLSLLLKKYELQTSTADEIVPSKSKNRAQASDKARNEEVQRGKHKSAEVKPAVKPSPKMRSRDALGNSLQSLDLSRRHVVSLDSDQSNIPLVAAGLDEEDILLADWVSDEPADNRPSDPDLANVPSSDQKSEAVYTPSATSFEEERRILREGLALEAQQVAASIGIGEEDREESDEVRPVFNLLRAAATGDDYSVKALLSSFGNLSTETHAPLLGWTAWHISAWSGHVSVLECLKDDMVQKGTHHLVEMSRPSKMGMPPLGVACLRGQVDAVRSLLLGMAPIDVRDSFGNGALMWAVSGMESGRLVPLLLGASADPSVRNHHGHAPDVSGYAPASMDAYEPPVVGSPHSESSTIAVSDDQDVPDIVERFSEPYHQIYAIGARPGEQTNLLDKTLNLLKAPARDATGFGRSDQGKSLAQLTAAEASAGVYSDWVSNFTHAGLQSSLLLGQPHTDPASPERNRQALVLTTERLLLFQAAPWSLIQVIALSEILQLIVSVYSETVLIVRMHRMPDVLLDVAARPRFLEEMRLATSKIAEQWGGTADFSGVLEVHHEAEPLIPLMDEWRKPVAVISFIEQDVFLFLPFISNSVLLMAPETFFFGFLDFYHMHRPRSGGAAAWKWQTYFFILKGGQGSRRQFHWCQHPSDTASVDFLEVESIRDVRPLETPQENGYCLLLDYDGASGPEAMTLRARSENSREDWITSIQTMQTWT